MMDESDPKKSSNNIIVNKNPLKKNVVYGMMDQEQKMAGRNKRASLSNT